MSRDIAFGPTKKPANRGAAQHYGKKDWAIQAFFNGQAAHYSDFFNVETQTGAAVLFQARMALCVEMLAGCRGALIDCASGTGEITRAVALANPWERIFINDFSPLMVERCREVMSDTEAQTRVTWNVGSVFDLGKIVEGSCFDAALCLGLIAHCGRLPQLLAQVRQLLKDGGLLVLQSSLLDHPGDLITKFVARSLLSHRSYRIEGFRLATILDEARQAGFELVDLRRFGVCLPFGDRIFGRLNYWLERKFALQLEGHGGEALFVLRKR